MKVCRPGGSHYFSPRVDSSTKEQGTKEKIKEKQKANWKI